jgi:hypothetical protein
MLALEVASGQWCLAGARGGAGTTRSGPNMIVPRALWAECRAMRSASRPLERKACAAIVLAALTCVACAGLMIAAMLAPAPPAVVPLAVVVCIGCPIAMAWPVPGSVSILRASRRLRAGENERALKALRQHLSRLPEREHPLGL